MVSTDIRQCWVCASGRAEPWKARSIQRGLSPEDLQITDSRYGLTLELVRCLDCGFIQADAREMEELVQLYERLEDRAYEEGMENRAIQMRWLVDLARKANPNARTAVEIGSGIGLLVRELGNAGLEATGVEPSRSLVETGSRLLDVRLLQGTFPHPSLAGRIFDLVFMVDVIEHVSDPVSLLRACADAMSTRSVLMVVTPDVASVAARLLRQRWWHFRLAHVGYFNRTTMERAAAAAGLEITHRKRALWFFPIRYVASRLERYLPVGWLNRRLLPLRFFDRVISLNVFDSWVFLLRKKP